MAENKLINIPTFVLQLDLSCCSNRAKKVKEKLQKINGVYYINIDTENGLTLVSGYADPCTIQKTLGKKRMKILAYEQDFIEAEKKLYQFLRKIKKENKKDGKVTCSCDSNSSTDDDEDDEGKSNPCVSYQNNGIKSSGGYDGLYDPRVFGGYRIPPPPRAWYGNPYYTNMPYGYSRINYPANYNRPLQPPPPPRPQMSLSNVCAVFGGQTEAPVGSSLYHTFSDDNVRACNVM